MTQAFQNNPFYPIQKPVTKASVPCPCFPRLFTLHSSLFTIHYSLFTLHGHWPKILDIQTNICILVHIYVRTEIFDNSNIQPPHRMGAVMLRRDQRPIPATARTVAKRATVTELRPAHDING
jgi:hypothetical protein